MLNAFTAATTFPSTAIFSGYDELLQQWRLVLIKERKYVGTYEIYS
jgi:hypothetical protein